MIAVALAFTLTVFIPKSSPKVRATGPLLALPFFVTNTLTAGVWLLLVLEANKLAGVVAGVQVRSQYPVCTVPVSRAWVSALLLWRVAVAVIWPALQLGVRGVLPVV